MNWVFGTYAVMWALRQEQGPSQLNSAWNSFAKTFAETAEELKKSDFVKQTAKVTEKVRNRQETDVSASLCLSIIGIFSRLWRSLSFTMLVGPPQTTT
jgi:hypothetical protein